MPCWKESNLYQSDSCCKERGILLHLQLMTLMKKSKQLSVLSQMSLNRIRNSKQGRKGEGRSNLIRSADFVYEKSKKIFQ